MVGDTQQSLPNEEMHSKVMPKHQKVWRVKRYAANKLQQIGKQRLQMNTTSEWKGQQFNVKEEKPLWWTESWVGIMVSYKSMEEVREFMLRQGLGDIRVRYLGDKEVLLKANDGPIPVSVNFQFSRIHVSVSYSCPCPYLGFIGYKVNEAKAGLSDKKVQFQTQLGNWGTGDAAQHSQGWNGVMHLVNAEPLNPREMEGKTPMWRGESRRRKKYKRIDFDGVQPLSIKSRSVSCSINDSNIFNCNRRVKERYREVGR